MDHQKKLQLKKSFINGFDSNSNESERGNNDQGGVFHFRSVKLSYFFANRIAKSSNSFSDDEFIKKCV